MVTVLNICEQYDHSSKSPQHRGAASSLFLGLYPSFSEEVCSQRCLVVPGFIEGKRLRGAEIQMVCGEPFGGAEQFIEF